jgi:acyl carrier protein
MTDRVVLGKIIEALAEYLKRDAASITESHHLREDLGLDSMAVIELLYRIEETFNLQIPDQDLPGLTTVGAVATYVQKRLAPAGKPPSSGPKKQTAGNKKTKT